MIDEKRRCCGSETLMGASADRRSCDQLMNHPVWLHPNNHDKNNKKNFRMSLFCVAAWEASGDSTNGKNWSLQRHLQTNFGLKRKQMTDDTLPAHLKFQTALMKIYFKLLVRSAHPSRPPGLLHTCFSFWRSEGLWWHWWHWWHTADAFTDRRNRDDAALSPLEGRDDLGLKKTSDRSETKSWLSFLDPDL